MVIVTWKRGGELLVSATEHSFIGWMLQGHIPPTRMVHAWSHSAFSRFIGLIGLPFFKQLAPCQFSVHQGEDHNFQPKKPKKHWRKPKKTEETHHPKLTFFPPENRTTTQGLCSWLWLLSEALTEFLAHEAEMQGLTCSWDQEAMQE